ncbi:hypothetical protein NWP96_07145 [Mycoplasmopsis cynos]|nr:hypothetical protein [Mycoplasmopsis cynos]
MNGKLDLIKAEAIHDLIMSKTITQVKASVNRFKGKTSDLIDKFINKISLIIGMAKLILIILNMMTLNSLQTTKC